MFCKELNDAFKLNPALAAWLPNLIVFPLGLFLTIKAMNDSKILDVDRIFMKLAKLIPWLNIKGKDNGVD